MPAIVSNLADHRAVFVLPDRRGTVAFLASRGPSPRIAHERRFVSDAEAMQYARGLSLQFGCPIVASEGADLSGEDVA